MPESIETELKIISDVLEGRTEAFEALVRKYQRPVYFLILRMVRQVEEADDLTQQVFLKAYKSLRGFRGESSFKTWLSKIALNLARTALRKGKRIFVEFDEAKASAPREGAEDLGAKRAWMRRFLGQLPATQREVVSLRIYEEKSFQEIADLMDSKEGTVKVNFHHALKQLRKWWLQKGKDEE